ncbi:MAG TPA: DMT family transporter [Bryobacteraceae bacterium]
MNRAARWRADLALTFIAVVWGATFVLVKQALLDISTMYFLALRFGLASVSLLALFLPSFRRMPAPAFWRGLRGGAVAGGFLALGYVLQTFGLKYTSAGNSGFLTGLYIVLVPLLGAAVFRRWPQARELFGILIAAVGLVVLTLPSIGGGFSLKGFNRGDLLTVGCAIAFAGHLLVLGYYSQRERIEAVAIGQIACAAVLFGVSLFVEQPKATWNQPVISALLVTGILGTAVAFAVQTWAQQFTTATRTALIFALEPVMALLTAVLAGGERLTRAAVLGGALILAGIVTVEIKPSRRVVCE